MTHSGKRFSARDFLSVIERVEEALPLAVEGLVKADPEDPDVILFEPSKSCNRWLRLPVSMIESIEPIGRYQCNDHSHPIVRLVFAEPTTPEAAALAALAGYLGEMLSMIERASQRLETLPADGGNGAGAATPDSCWAKCDRDYPNDWVKRWSCKLYC